MDSKSLVNAASVNRRWNSICKSDAILRKRIHKRLRQERKARIEAYMKPSKSVKITRQENVSAVQFGVRNENVSIQKLPVKYEAPKSSKHMKPQVKAFATSLRPNGKTPKTKITDINNNVKRSRNLRL